MNFYDVQLYTDDKPVITLSGHYPNRHYIEEKARQHIKEGRAESMGAINVTYCDDGEDHNRWR